MASMSLRRSASAPSNVTDGTFLPGGQRIALLTYSSVEVIDATSYEVVAQRPNPRSAAGGVADPQPGPEVAAGRQRGQEVQGVFRSGAERGYLDAHPGRQHRSRRRKRRT